ncbi:sulfurtransferase [Thermosynechococcaceae cyanobacterium BACA0444]|uniref:Sulfurtransferase n=1 Tax=Pseudocalidococcus azoricus BACA0444 TaxID=2918990 RepID=A0AAE4JXV3_9CYAN|nr:sulfurtransferase [Pseudocalidococcus azoricus]MDS3861418.1 sulfurtransferase [Pseudocalidococcus azoricus BACA0444]
MKALKRSLSRLGWRSTRLFLAIAFLLAVVALPVTLIVNANAAPGATIQFVSPDWVKSQANNSNLRILDVRNNPLEYISAHLPNAVNIADAAFRGPDGRLPVQYWSEPKLTQILGNAGVSNNSKVLVYSDARDVLGATMVAYILERLGFQDIAVLDGGFTGYKVSNGEVTKAYPKYSVAQPKVQDNPNIRVNLAQVKQLIGKPGVVFVDPRPPKLFSGEENVFIRNGHIPGARNIPWPTFTTTDNPHKLKSLDEIKAILASKKVDPSQDVIVTCSTGREATLQYIVLKHLLKYPKVRIYEGSWTEYSATDLPVQTGPDPIG